jgi:hypothetical protein
MTTENFKRNSTGNYEIDPDHPEKAVHTQFQLELISHLSPMIDYYLSNLRPELVKRFSNMV